MSQVNPGWYPDPDGKPCDRYWNGTEWTLETRPKGLNQVQLVIPANQGMSNGWKVVFAICLGLTLLILAYAASDPTFWDY